MLTVTTPPAGYPVSVEEMETQLRLGDSGEDTFLTAIIAAATAQIEWVSGRSLLTQSLTLTLPRFPLSSLKPVWLMRGPVASLTSVSYVDADGATQTLASCQLEKTEFGAKLLPPLDDPWPDTQDLKVDAVSIVYVAGYGAASAVPAPLKQAIVLLASDFYERRTETVVGASVGSLGLIDALVAPYRIYGFG